jgi:hypothetical protein
MKSLRFIAIAVLLATAIVNSASAGEPRTNLTRNVIKVTLYEAIQSPGLVAAMHQQLTGGFLGGPAIHDITLRVTFEGHVYMITGTQDQWELFFRSGGINQMPLWYKSAKTNALNNNN